MAIRENVHLKTIELFSFLTDEELRSIRTRGIIQLTKQ